MRVGDVCHPQQMFFAALVGCVEYEYSQLHVFSGMVSVALSPHC